MWNCKKCNEENEDSFDSCWNCQTFSNEGSQKSSETQRKIVKEEKNKKDEDDFEESIVGPNGEITFNKVSGVNNMSLQVYAPIGGTVWNAKVGCKALTPTT